MVGIRPNHSLERTGPWRVTTARLDQASTATSNSKTTGTELVVSLPGADRGFSARSERMPAFGFPVKVVRESIPAAQLAAVRPRFQRTMAWRDRRTEMRQARILELAMTVKEGRKYKENETN